MACLPGSGPPLNPYVDDAGGPPGMLLGGDSGTRVDVDLGPAFAITGLQPSHGPWNGGTRTTVAGRGFASEIQVWIGGKLLDATDVLASDPTHAAIVTPPGLPGPADVRVRNTTTAEEAVLPGGFTYDAITITPSSGSTTGGTRIALTGLGTHWTQASTVSLGGGACTGIVYTDATHLSCSTPPHGPGSQDVTVTNADGSVDQALDAFLYSDSPDGYRGGLYGGALSGTLQVLAFDSWTGTPLAGGKAIAGSSLAGAVIGTFNGSGVAQLTGPSLSGKVTVTVAAKCHQPITYVDVPVDTVTAYLDPEITPSCAGDPPSSGNYTPVTPGEIDGELVWPGGIEFQRGGWGNVPMPSGANERQAAYVWTAAGSPLASFWLPGASSATTPDSDGSRGYSYSLSALPGNQTLYALAGLEDRTASYWTDAMTFVQVSVIEEEAAGSVLAAERVSGTVLAGSGASPTPACSGEPWSSGWGEVAIVEKVVGYKKIKFYTHENAGYGDVRLPEMQMHTTAFWVTVPESVCAGIQAGRPAVIDGLRGLGIALETVATLALMCDPRDLGTTLGTTTPEEEGGPAVPRKGFHPLLDETYRPTLFVYEHVPGGTGLAERIWEQRDVLLARSARMIETCPCDKGCPSCVGPGEESRKATALELLRSAVPTA